MYIYVASPYSAPFPDTIEGKELMEYRFEMVQAYYAKLVNDKMVAYSPIALNHPVAVKFELPRGYEFWKNYDRIMVSQASALHVYCLPGWRDSVGVTDEVAIARKLNIPVKYINPATFEEIIGSEIGMFL